MKWAVLVVVALAVAGCASKVPPGTPSGDRFPEPDRWWKGVVP